jgi:hypothetical protein
MSTLADTQANYGLFGDATPTSLAGTNKRRIGRNQQRLSFAESDVLYRVQLTATAAGDVATLNTQTGAVTQDGGTPSVTRWTGETDNLAAKDFEGVTIPELLSSDRRLYAVIIEMSAGNSKYIAMDSSTDWFPGIVEGQPGLVLLASPGGAAGFVPVALPDLEFTWESDAASIGGSVTVTVCARS